MQIIFLSEPSDGDQLAQKIGPIVVKILRDAIGNVRGLAEIRLSVRETSGSVVSVNTSSSQFVSCNDIAQAKRCSPRTVQNVCQQLGIKQRIAGCYFLDKPTADLVMSNIHPSRGRPRSPHTSLRTRR